MSCSSHNSTQRYLFKYKFFKLIQFDNHADIVVCFILWSRSGTSGRCFSHTSTALNHTSASFLPSDSRRQLRLSTTTRDVFQSWRKLGVRLLDEARLNTDQPSVANMQGWWRGKSFPKTTETNFYIFIFQTFYKTLICCLDRMQEAQYCIHVYPQYEARTSWFSLVWSGTRGGSPKRTVYVHFTKAHSLVQ